VLNVGIAHHKQAEKTFFQQISNFSFKTAPIFPKGVEEKTFILGWEGNGMEATRKHHHERNAEAINILMEISVVSRRLALNLAKRMEGDKQNARDSQMGRRCCPAAAMRRKSDRGF